MFRRSDFRKLELFGGGKKNTKVFKVEYIATGQIFALKEVEAKNLDKLNEYKEEAVQLSKAQHHPNVMQSYGYYFYETSHNSYKLGIISEYIHRNLNLEVVYRIREKQHLYWSEDKLLKIAYNLIDTFAYLEHIGICHRDIKPTNLFLLEDYQIKVIDFGESIENYDDEDEENQMATIRGTPQYLSPILWEAHVILKAKEAEHNMFKSDVFSAGLVLYQLAAMKDVGGFNQKTPQCDGEVLIKEGLKQLSKSYSNKLVEIIRRMLIFNEEDRPTFEQLGIFIAGEDYVPRVDRTIIDQIEDFKKKKIEEKILNDKITEKELEYERERDEEKKKKFISYVNNHKIPIMTKNSTYWFEYGGKGCAQFNFKSKNKKKEENENLTGKENNSANNKEKEEKEKKENKEENKWKNKNVKTDIVYPMHFILAYVDETYGYFLIGGTDNGNCFQFKDGTITPKANMNIQRSFMSVISYDQLIFAIGGYDFAEKNQTGSIEIYEVQTNEWKTGILKDLRVPRSQAGALLMNSTSIYVFGGYSKSLGTLNSIEHISIETKENKLIELTLPIPLRRFGLFPISENKAILLGGESKNSQKIDKTFIVDLNEQKVKEGITLSRGGVLEHEIIFEDNGKVHLFFENNYGTAPPEHLCVDFFGLWNK
jgi:serine/threonine protein kinase